MALIKFKEWMQKHDENAGMPPAPGVGPMSPSMPANNPGDPASQIKLLQQQLNDPNTPHADKQGIMAQVSQLRLGSQANPAQPQPNAQPNAQPYKWQNGRPVAANSNQM